jgi:hypothetical protein
MEPVLCLGDVENRLDELFANGSLFTQSIVLSVLLDRSAFDRPRLLSEITWPRIETDDGDVLRCILGIASF